MGKEAKVLCSSELCDGETVGKRHRARAGAVKQCPTCLGWYCEECWKWHYCLPEDHPTFEGHDDKSASGD